MTFPTDETEFRLCWSSQGGKVAVIGELAAMLDSLAAEAFTRRKDEIAHALRDAAGKIERRHKEASDLLQAYIVEDVRRSAEFRLKMKAERPQLKIKRT